jgi:hypothetical protein
MAKDEGCRHHSGLQSEIDNLKDSDTKLWEAVEKLQNRLPVWATVCYTSVISLLTFLLGCTITYAKFAG